MSVDRSDYIGFSYNGVHSSDLGIIRTSEGSRFNENLLPTIQDKTVQVPGGDGTYYFGSYFTQRQFSVSFAFDKLTEEQVARIKAHFGDKKIHKLVFDERPYKIYHAKVTGTATLKYIPFTEGETNRLYKGEGSIQFTCYQPYATCEKKWLSDYSDWNNIEEWKSASGLKQTSTGYNVLNSNKVKLYNAGDIEVHFQYKINFVNDMIPANGLYISNDPSRQLYWEQIQALSKNGKADDYIIINTKLNLIEGYYNGVKSGNIYNQHITDGTFFKIPLGESEIVFNNGTDMSVDSEPIAYDYYYF